MGGFPSGQRGQTVNLLSTTSVVRIHHLPPKRQSIERYSVLFYSQNLEWEQWIRKPALGNMLDACCNRRGFSAEKRIHHLPPKKRVQICALFCFVRKTKSPCQRKFEKPCQLIPALSVAARHLSQRERQVWSVRKSKTKALVPEKFPVLVLFLCLSASYSPSSSGSEDCSSSFLSSTNSFFAASSKETVASAACGASVPFSSSCFAVFAMPDSMWNTCAPVS